MTEDEIEQLRHAAANAEQNLSAAETIVLRALAAIELKDDAEAKRLLRGLLAALRGHES